MVQMRKLRFREVKEVAQNHTASRCWGHVSGLAQLTPNTVLPQQHLHTCFSVLGNKIWEEPDHRASGLVLEAREAQPRMLRWLR